LKQTLKLFDFWYWHLRNLGRNNDYSDHPKYRGTTPQETEALSPQLWKAGGYKGVSNERRSNKLK